MCTVSGVHKAITLSVYRENLTHLIIPSYVGMSSTGVAISEKHSDVKFSGESRIGIPFNILMRDILQFDDSLDDALRCVIIEPLVVHYRHTL